MARQGSSPICLPEYDQSNNGTSLKNVPPVFDFDEAGRESIDRSNTELNPVGVRNDDDITSVLRCALCFLPNLPAPTLIAGTHECPKTGVWRREYYGQLVTPSASGSDVICANLPQVTQHQQTTNQTFAYLLSSVSADCQGISPGCPQGKMFEEIPCALCTRTGQLRETIVSDYTPE